MKRLTMKGKIFATGWVEANFWTLQFGKLLIAVGREGKAKPRDPEIESELKHALDYAEKHPDQRPSFF